MMFRVAQRLVWTTEAPDLVGVRATYDRIIELLRGEPGLQSISESSLEVTEYPEVGVEAPPYVHDILLAWATQTPLNFRGHEVPEDVRRWIERATGEKSSL